MVGLRHGSKPMGAIVTVQATPIRLQRDPGAVEIPAAVKRSPQCDGRIVSEATNSIGPATIFANRVATATVSSFLMLRDILRPGARRLLTSTAQQRTAIPRRVSKSGSGIGGRASKPASARGRTRHTLISYVLRLARDPHGPKRNRRHPRPSEVQGPAGRVGGAAQADRGGLRCLAGRWRRRARDGRRRRPQGRMVDRSGQRFVPGAALLPRRRLLLGVDREPSPDGDRGGAGGSVKDARGRVPARPRASLSRGLRRRAESLGVPARPGIFGRPDRDRRRQRRRGADRRAHRPAARRNRGGAGVSLARFALDRSHHVGRDDEDEGRRRSAHPRGLS